MEDLDRLPMVSAFTKTFQGEPQELISLVNPLGGYNQAKKTVQGIGAVNKGVETNKNGEVMYPIEQTPGNYIRGGLFGKYSLPESREYWDNDRRALEENQTAEFYDRVGKGENPKDVYNEFIQQRQADNQYTKTVEANVKPFDTATADALTEIYEEYQNIDADAHGIGVPKATKVFKYKGKSYDLTAEQYAELQNRYNTEYYEEITKILNNNNLSVERKYKKIAEIRSDVMSDVKSQFYREFLR